MTTQAPTLRLPPVVSLRHRQLATRREAAGKPNWVSNVARSDAASGVVVGVDDRDGEACAARDDVSERVWIASGNDSHETVDAGEGGRCLEIISRSRNRIRAHAACR